MPRVNTTRLLDQLDELKNQFHSNIARRVERLLNQLAHKDFDDTDLLLRYHELLLFLRAYPHNASTLRLTERALRNFSKRVERFRELEIDLGPLQHPEVSGIAGTSVIDTFSFYIVRWLLERHALQVALYWDWFEDENRLAETWPRFMPLLEEDALVEANVPYREWLRAARGRSPELAWLMERFNELPRDEKERAELYDSQKLYIRWIPGFDVSRTGMRLAGKSFFYHRGPLIQRREIDLRKELDQPPPPLQRLSTAQGEDALDRAREASTIRYRELYGFTHGDPKYIYQTDLGRGVQLFLMGLPAKKRLPLRAYHAAMIYKNGVPIGYFEGLSLFERMESGFNLYYTFRDGETAWLYARVLNVMRHFTGVTTFAIDPYQIGFENEEGIESGAFWFYRKLGFRPTRRDVLKLVEKEEQKIATRKGYRTSARTLRRLAESSMVFELDQQMAGDWDRFEVRKIGFRAQREKLSELLSQIARAKAAPEETTYLKALRRDKHLREQIIKLGS